MILLEDNKSDLSKKKEEPSYLSLYSEYYVWFSEFMFWSYNLFLKCADKRHIVMHTHTHTGQHLEILFLNSADLEMHKICKKSVSKI